MDQEKIDKAADILRTSKYAVAFTGAGISVESGVPPFRGADGIWANYDPIVLDLDYFYANPEKSWTVIRELFYKFFGVAKANPAHKALAELEKAGIIKSVITQNIDNLHQQAGSKVVYEFHGNSQRLLCVKCGKNYTIDEISLDKLPPQCSCGGLLKPDFIFFGEGIPQETYQLSMEAIQKADVVLIIGSTGEVMPAAQLPFLASQHGASIIEVNPDQSKFTTAITDLHLKGKAGEVMLELKELVYEKKGS